MAYTIGLSKRFLRAFSKLDADLQQEIIERVELLKEQKNHTRLKVHKLSGKLKGIVSFSVNYRIRITFTYANKDTVAIHSVGTHDEVY